MSVVSYLAVDLETTGLDPQLDAILEIAWAPLDFWFQPLAPVRSLVLTDTPQAWERLAANDYVMKMHAQNGLLADSLNSPHSVADAERAVLDGNMGGDFAGKPVIFGSSVHFDLRFIQTQMPTLASVLHYRVFDVSTVLALSAACGASGERPENIAHRAAADITWSIRAAQNALETLSKGRRAA